MQHIMESEVQVHEKDDISGFKHVDRGYDNVYRFKETSSGKVKRTKMDVFTTESSRGSKIRNAESGHYYNHRVGTLNEHLYFKVALSTGEVKPKNSSNILFYDSPSQYEEHLNGIVSDDVKRSWCERRDAFIRTRQPKETSQQLSNE